MAGRLEASTAEVAALRCDLESRENEIARLGEIERSYTRATRPGAGAGADAAVGAGAGAGPTAGRAAAAGGRGRRTPSPPSSRGVAKPPSLASKLGGTAVGAAPPNGDKSSANPRGLDLVYREVESMKLRAKAAEKRAKAPVDYRDLDVDEAAPYTPEVRTKMYEEGAEQKAEKDHKQNAMKPKERDYEKEQAKAVAKARDREERGAIQQCNQGKWEFH